MDELIRLHAEMVVARAVFEDARRVFAAAALVEVAGRRVLLREIGDLLGVATHPAQRAATFIYRYRA